MNSHLRRLGLFRGAGLRRAKGRAGRSASRRRRTLFPAERLEARTLLAVQAISLARASLFGESGNARSGGAVLSADGRFAAYTSDAGNLAPGDSGAGQDIFVRELATGRTALVSATPAGTSGRGQSRNPVLSADGRFVAFESDAPDLVPGDNNGATDVFVRDVVAGTTVLVSVNAGGTGSASGISSAHSISADGRFVAFRSYARDVLPVPNAPGFSVSNVFVRDLVAGTTAVVNVDRSGQADNQSFLPALSADGRFVVFVTGSDNMTAGDTNGTFDAFVRDMALGTTTLVSAGLAGDAAGINTAFLPAISADGRSVSFVSASSGLAAGDSNNADDVFVRDLVDETTHLASVNLSEGTSWGSYLSSPVLSADGRHVAFVTFASDLAEGDTNGGYDVFVRDLDRGVTTLATVNPGGIGGDGSSTSPALSADGRYVAFVSDSGDMVVGDMNGQPDVFVRDLVAHVTTLASVGGGGTGGGDGPSRAPAISQDGRVVVFESDARDLVADDRNGASDVFSRDLVRERVDLVSRRDPGLPRGFTANGPSGIGSVSADGRFVAFVSQATNIVPEDIRTTDDVYVRDLAAGAPVLVSVNRAGTAGGNDGSGAPVLSSDGRFVAFSSYASDLVDGDGNRSSDVFVRDLIAGTTRLVSVNAAGTGAASGWSGDPRLSADGRYVAFLSDASDLVSGVAGRNIYLRDLVAGTTTLVSVNAAGTGPGTGDTFAHEMSADGRYVVFLSNASDVVAGDTNGTYDAFLRDVRSGTTVLISANRTGAAAGLSPMRPALSADGRFVAFVSDATDLVVGDTNPSQNLFVRDVSAGRTISVNVNRSGRTSLFASREPSLSADGRFISFFSFAPDLVAGDTNNAADVFVRDLVAGTTTLVSVNAAGTASGNAPSNGANISADGRYVAFMSVATDLAGPDTNGLPDVFVRDLAAGTTTLVSINSTGSASGAGESSVPKLSADGETLAFQSIAPDLAGVTDANGAYDIFVRREHAGAISGMVFADLDGDGSRDAGESGLSGWTVYLDADHDGAFDGGEVGTSTDLGGIYSFSDLAPGTYEVAVVVRAGYQPTLPIPQPSYTVTIDATGGRADGRDFGNVPLPPDLAVQAVVHPSEGVAGQPVELTWTVANLSDVTVDGDWEDALFLSLNPTPDVGDRLIAVVPHSGPLAPGASYTGRTTVNLPGVLPGSYYVLVETDRRHSLREGPDEANNVRASEDVMALSIPALGLDVPSAGEFTDAGQSRYYQISVPRGRTVVLTLDSAAASGSTELYVKLGAPPSPSDFDARSVVAFRPDQSLVFETSVAGTYYVVASSRSGEAARSAYSLTASLPELDLLSVTPGTASGAGPVTLTLDGVQFTPLVAVSLVGDGVNIPAVSVDYVDGSRLHATFDLTGRDPGLYDVLVEVLSASDGLPTGQAVRLADAFQLVEGNGARLVTRVVAPSAVRAGQAFAFYVEYANEGDADLPPGMLVVREAGGGLTRLAQSGRDYGDRVNLMLLNPGYASGVLPPGATGRIALEGIAPGASGEVSYELSFVPAESTEPFPWSDVEAAWRPEGVADEEWAPYWSDVTGRIGATWSDVLGRVSLIAGSSRVRGPEVYSFDGLLSWAVTLESSRPEAARSRSALSDATLDPSVEAYLYDAENDVRLETADGELLTESNWLANASRTFIVTHGNGGPADRFRALAAALKENYPDANVVLVQWPRGAGHILPTESAPHIDDVGIVAADRLRRLPGFVAAKVTLIGESFGNYVNHRIAQQVGEVGRIVAMDPASEFGGYPPPDLRLVSQVAYSFITCNPFDTKRHIADKNFVLETPEGMWSWLDMHTYGIPWLSMLLRAHITRVLDEDLSSIPEGDCDDPNSPRFQLPLRERFRIPIVRAVDPNEKVGPAGQGPRGYIDADRSIPYTVFFENTPALATAPAQEVVITDVLDPDLDWSTFELGTIGFGSVQVDVPAGLQSFRTRVEASNQDGSPLLVDIEASLDMATGVATWQLTSVDPSTGLLPADPFAGLLPVNDATHRGEGFARYLVRPRAGLASGSLVENTASIVFDINEPIVTNTVLNTLDAAPPTSSVAPLPPQTTAQRFLVRWSGSDDVGGSGIATYDVFVSVDGGAAAPWLAGTTATAADFVGQFGHSYGFLSVAVDRVGHRQAMPSAVQGIIDVTLVASDDAYRVRAGESLVVTAPGLTVNDSKAEDGTLTALLTASPSHGTVTVHADGSFIYNADPGYGGIDTFRYSVRAAGLTSAEATVVLTVFLNTAPEVFVGTDATVDEGSLLARSGSFRDDDADVWTATVDYGDGSGPRALALNPDKSFILSHTYADDGEYTVTVRVADGTESGSQSFRVVVKNVAPRAVIGGPTNGVRGQTLRFEGGFHDPGAHDVVTFAWRVDGPGGSTLATGIGSRIDWLPTATGTYIVRLTVTDDDSGSGSTWQSVVISDWALLDDPGNPGKTALFIGGTTADDIIDVNPGGGADGLKFQINGRNYSTTAPTGHLIIYGLAGDDVIRVNAGVKLSALLHGGDGNDRLWGNNEGNVLLGGPGNDELAGGKGRDLIIGGEGADRIDGGAGDDILIGGSTQDDADELILGAILDEWGRSGLTVGQRVSALGSRLNASRVYDDMAVDQVSGRAGDDWFLINPDQDLAKEPLEVLTATRKKRLLRP